MGSRRRPPPPCLRHPRTPPRRAGSSFTEQTGLLYCKPFTNPQSCYKTATSGFFLWGENTHTHLHSRTRTKHGRRERREKKGGGGQRGGRLETGKCAPGQERAFSGLASQPCQRSPRHPRGAGGNCLSGGSFPRRLCHIHCYRRYPARPRILSAAPRSLPSPPRQPGKGGDRRERVLLWGPRGPVAAGENAGFLPGERGSRSVRAATRGLGARGKRSGHPDGAVSPSPPRCT